MKTKLLLLAVSVAAFSSCATMYKTGQTPDDVYYSPTRAISAGQEDNRNEVREEPIKNYSGEDRTIRMGINDYRYRSFNNDYRYSPYSFYDQHSYYGSNYYNGNYYSSNLNHFYYNDYYYNPYYSSYPVYVTPATHIKNSTPRVTNLNGYTHNYNNTNNPLMSVPAVRPVTQPAGRSSALGNILNKVFTPATNNKNNYDNKTSNNTFERTYTPPPANNNNSSSSGSSSSGSSGSRITRPN